MTEQKKTRTEQKKTMTMEQVEEEMEEYRRIFDVVRHHQKKKRSK